MVHAGNAPIERAGAGDETVAIERRAGNGRGLGCGCRAGSGRRFVGRGGRFTVVAAGRCGGRTTGVVVIVATADKSEPGDANPGFRAGAEESSPAHPGIT